MTTYIPFIRAIQFDGSNVEDVQTLLEEAWPVVDIDDTNAPDSILINTRDAENNPAIGDVTVNNGFWVTLSGVDSFNYMSDTVFQAQYVETPS